MNKDKQEDKVDSIRQTIGVLLSGMDTGLVEVPRYQPRELKEDETIENVLMEEMLFMVRAARKDVRRKRVRLFFVGPFFIPSSIRRIMKKQYQESAKAYKYILTHKTELRKYMSKVKLGILDHKSTWLDPCYNCGENVKYRINEEGVVERNIAPFGADPKYQLVGSSYVYREPAPKAVTKHSSESDKVAQAVIARWRKTEQSTLEKEEGEALQEKAMAVAEEVALEMANSTEPYKGIAAFRTNFKNRVDKQLREMNIPYREIQGNMSWIRSLNILMNQTWKKRLECTENSKNSSTQKDDDSQS